MMSLTCITNWILLRATCLSPCFLTWTPLASECDFVSHRDSRERVGPSNTSKVMKGSATQGAWLRHSSGFSFSVDSLGIGS